MHSCMSMVTRLFIYAQTQVAHVNPQGSQLREEERAGSPKDFKAFSEEGHKLTGVINVHAASINLNYINVSSTAQ